MYHAFSPSPSPSPFCTDTDVPPPPLLSDIDIDTSPPPLPPDSVYTSCYCEENIYLLAQAFTQLSDADSTPENRGPWPWQIYVVFISNGGKTVALWSQKTSSGVVVWDYHVVLVLLPRTPLNPGSDGAPTPESDSQGTAERHAWVYDLDTTLPVPCPWIENATQLHWRGYLFVNCPRTRTKRRLFAPLRLRRRKRANPRRDGFRNHAAQRARGHTIALLMPRTSAAHADRAAQTTSRGRFPTPPRAPAAASTRGSTDRPPSASLRVARSRVRAPSLFRVIRGDVYLDHFASDRSHMITPALTTDMETQRASGGASEGRGRIDEAAQAAEEGPRYASPPPGYPPICGAKARAMGIADNLMRSFVAMDPLPAPLAEEGEDKCEDEGPGSTASEAVRYGQVMDMDAFLHWLAGSSDVGA